MKIFFEKKSPHCLYFVCLPLKNLRNVKPFTVEWFKIKKYHAF